MAPIAPPAPDHNLYGLDRELAHKQAAKYSQEREQEAREWLSMVTGIPLDPQGSLHEQLKDGMVLLK